MNRSLLRRALPLATALALAAPVTAAHAADSLGAGGVTIPGSALRVGVSGAAGQAGKVSARFSGAPTSLFYGTDVTGLNDNAAMVFAMNTPYGLYSGLSGGVDNAPFTQTSAPVLTGTGGAGDPYVVTSHFDATANLHITQTITHVSGTTRFTGTWAVNNTSSITPLMLMVGGDTYAGATDTGSGTITGISPNRVIGQMAPDASAVQLMEQSISPWSHYYSGEKTEFRNISGDSSWGSLSDSVNPTSTNSAETAEWDVNLGSNATKTVSVVWNFTPPALPGAPSIVGGLPANGATTPNTAAAPTFAAPGATSYECALDGGSFTACSSPKNLTGLIDGAHTFSVRALNSAGQAGPQTDRTWTVDTAPPASPTLTGAPTGTVATNAATVTLTGEAGATFTCSVDGSSYVPCSSPLVVTGLANGPHTVKVKQQDTAGNVSVAPAIASWTVDTTVPTAPAGVVAPADSEATGATIPFTEVNGFTYECALDGGTFVACTSPVTYAGLATGAHTFKVRAVNAAGTQGAAAQVGWTVNAPVVPVTPVTPEPPVAPTPTPTPTPTPEAPVATPTPSPTPTATPNAPQPKFTATVGGQATTSSAGGATVAVAKQAVDVGCKMTGVELASCKVDLYADVPAGHAAAAAKVLVGTGTVEADSATSKLSVRVVLNATGRELLRTAKHGLAVQVAITGKPVSGEAIQATGSARLVAKRSTLTVGGFAVDQATLTPAAKRALVKLAKRLASGATVRITGYTDNSSSDTRHLRALGLERAKAVKAFLAAHGAKATYTVVSRGAAAPRAANTTAAGRALNRRVVLQIVR